MNSNGVSLLRVSDVEIRTTSVSADGSKKVLEPKVKESAAFGGNDVVDGALKTAVNENRDVDPSKLENGVAVGDKTSDDDFVGAQLARGDINGEAVGKAAADETAKVVDPCKDQIQGSVRVKASAKDLEGNADRVGNGDAYEVVNQAYTLVAKVEMAMKYYQDFGFHEMETKKEGNGYTIKGILAKCLGKADPSSEEVVKLMEDKKTKMGKEKCTLEEFQDKYCAHEFQLLDSKFEFKQAKPGSLRGPQKAKICVEDAEDFSLKIAQKEKQAQSNPQRFVLILNKRSSNVKPGEICVFRAKIM